jgi:hypothetical protein
MDLQVSLLPVFGLSMNSKSAFARSRFFKAFFLERVTFSVSIFSLRASYNFVLIALEPKHVLSQKRHTNLLRLEHHYPMIMRKIVCKTIFTRDCNYGKLNSNRWTAIELFFSKNAVRFRFLQPNSAIITLEYILQEFY